MFSGSLVLSRLAALSIAFFGAAASAATVSPPLPAPLQALERQVLAIVGTIPSPGGLTAYSAFMGHQPVALYMTPDGKNVTAGTPFDSDGKKVTAGTLGKLAGKPMTNVVLGQLSKSLWIPDGRDGAARTVYVFTDPNCPYCNKLWDLLTPGVKVLTVAGAGQTGLWEDVAGRTGDIGMVRAFRKNMVFPEAANSAAAKQQWIQQKDIDAWLIWNIWQVANPDVAQVVPMDEPFRIYRDAGVVLTRKGGAVPQARAFVEYLQSAEGRKIFAKWGWDAR